MTPLTADEYLKGLRPPKGRRSVLEPYRREIQFLVSNAATQQQIADWLQLRGVKTTKQNLSKWLQRAKAHVPDNQLTEVKLTVANKVHPAASLPSPDVVSTPKQLLLKPTPKPIGFVGSEVLLPHHADHGRDVGAGISAAATAAEQKERRRDVDNY